MRMDQIAERRGKSRTRRSRHVQCRSLCWSRIGRRRVAAVLFVAGGLVVSACSSAGQHSRAVPSTSSTTSAGGYPLLAIKGQEVVSLPSGPPGTHEGPAPGQQDLAFTTVGTGFLVTSSSVPGPPPAYGGRIQRTTDGGASWVTVWQQPGASLYWVGTAGSEVMASGALTPPGDNNSSTPSPLLLASSDGGTSWVMITPSIPTPPGGMTAGGAWPGFRLNFLTSSVGLAVPDAADGQEIFDAQLLRTTDAGRHWVAVELPGGTPNGGLAFVDPMDGFATGTTAKCQGQIWSTHDAGVTWAAVAGTCEGYLLDALSFPDSQDGFAAGGNYYKYGFYPQLAMLATTDRGRHWTTRYAQGGSQQGAGPGEGPFAQVHFVTPIVGYALSGGCVMGANGPCGGALWSSTDGGRTWTQNSRSGLRLATDGPDGLWLVDAGAAGGGDALWHSSDRAATWTPVADPVNIAISSLAASGDTLWIAGEAGQFTSRDGGRTWAALPLAARQAEQRSYGSVLAIDPSGFMVVGDIGASQLWISHDGGVTGHTGSLSGLGPFGIVSVAFADDHHGLAIGQGSLVTKNPAGPETPVLATDDGGSTWHQISQLAIGRGSLGYGSTVALAINPGPASTVATSTDAGAQWKTSSIPNAYPCFAASAAGDTAVMLCTYVTSAGVQPTPILVSRDAGRDWYAYSLESSQPPNSVVAAGSGQLWASGPPGLLWHSSDGGAHWSALTPSLPIAS